MVVITATIILGGITMIFTQLGDRLTASHQIDRNFENVREFRSDYESLKSAYPVFFTASTGSSFSQSLYGFQSVVFTNT